MAAETTDFDSSFDSEHREDGIDRMIGDVLEDSFEEIPEASDEFWKPVISLEENMSRQQPAVEITESPSPLDSESEKVENHHAARSKDEYPLPVYSMTENNCSCFDEGVQFLRRSKSEDILCKNQTTETGHQSAYYESCHMQQNYVTTPDKRSNFSDSLSSVEGNRPSDRFLLGDKGFKSFFDEYDKKLDCLEVKHTDIDNSFNDMQSILMELENFVVFIEQQYAESIEPAEKKSDDPSGNVAEAGNTGKKAYGDTEQYADTSEICEEDRIEKESGDQIDRCESGEDLKENDINQSIDITDIEKTSVENHDEISEENKEIVTDSTDKQTEERLEDLSGDEEKELCNGDNEKEQTEKSNSEVHVQGTDGRDGTKCDLAMDMRSFLMCLNSSLQEMYTRFQNFVNEVGETVHLGALATQHSQRMDSWASHVQRLYNSLKTDHNNMQEYIELREKDWIKVRSQLQTELETQGQQIHEVITALKEHEDVRRKSERSLSKRVGEKLLRKSERSKSLDKLDNNLVDILQKRRCDQEQAMALDFSRQLKITELKLILVRQQSYIQRLELQNKELDGVLRGVLFDPDTEQFSGNYFVRNPGQIGEGFNTMTDILHCDKANYLPGKSTDPDMVASQTFSIGPKTQRLSAEKEVMFDPKMLKYMCRETLAAINTDMDEIGSGEKVKQESDLEMIQLMEGETGNLNNSRDEKTSPPTVTQAERTELLSGPHLDVNGNVDLSLI